MFGKAGFNLWRLANSYECMCYLIAVSARKEMKERDKSHTSQDIKDTGTQRLPHIMYKLLTRSGMLYTRCPSKF